VSIIFRRKRNLKRSDEGKVYKRRVAKAVRKGLQGPAAEKAKVIASKEKGIGVFFIKQKEAKNLALVGTRLKDPRRGKEEGDVDRG